MTLHEAIAEQVNLELEAAYIYRTMQAYFADEDLPGMEYWMSLQVQEELEHAEKLVAHLEEIGAKVTFRPLDPGDGQFTSILDVWQKALAHEKEVTAAVNRLVDLAKEEDDRKSKTLLQWFVDEQVEEEDTFGTLVKQVERAGDSWAAIFALDAQLGQRQ